MCRVSLSCKCTDGLLSLHCKVLSYLNRFSLAKTWTDVTQQFSQTPNLFSPLSLSKLQGIPNHRVCIPVRVRVRLRVGLRVVDRVRYVIKISKYQNKNKYRGEGNYMLITKKTFSVKKSTIFDPTDELGRYKNLLQTKTYGTVQSLTQPF